MKRILVASAWLSPERSYDLAIWKKRRNVFAVNAPMTEHFGLRFLKENHPELTILEYPTREEFIAALRATQWDIVGISFYINETNDAIEMAECARRFGVPAVWAGNYGAMTKDISHHFDRILLGWGEEVFGNELGKAPQSLIHPPLYMHVSWHGMRLQTWGILFSSRGCNKTCTFCQTPRFYKKPYELDKDAVEAVIREYRRRNVSQVVLLDENFGYFEDSANEIIDLLHSYKLKWNPMTRVETLYRNYDSWKQRGLCGVSIGLESLNQKALDGARKGNDLVQRRELLTRLAKDHILTQTFYILGFEQDTRESIEQNIRELKSYHIDCPQIQILTPQPETQLFKYIESTYGINTYDYSKYDTTCMVWNHPSIDPVQMRSLMLWANDELFTAQSSFRTMKKIVIQALRAALRGEWRHLAIPLWTGNIDTLGLPIKELIKYGGRWANLDRDPNIDVVIKADQRQRGSEKRVVHEDLVQLTNPSPLGRGGQTSLATQSQNGA